MSPRYLVGLDFGTESARGVLVDATTGVQEAHHVHPYRHGVMTAALPSGQTLPPGFALQDAADYVEAAAEILRSVGAGREVWGIGLDFTASSPLPTRADGTPLSAAFPDEPHAYVKLWKHAAAQPQADAINATGGAYLANFGGKLSGEWLLPKAAELAADAPHLWAEAERFIEAGDWLVWQLTGKEVRSVDFAAYKAQWADGAFPDAIDPDLRRRLAPPSAVGTSAGVLSPAWRARTGILGTPAVAVAVIDSHVVLPAVGATRAGTFVGALGTSAGYLALDDRQRPFPAGIEGVAHGAALPGLWCYESGQAGFGDVLAWFARTFPRTDDPAETFHFYNTEAVRRAPNADGLVALDWWSGNRVPFGDSHLRGLMAGFTLATGAADMYRALMEAICFGARSIVDHLAAGGVPIDRVILTSGLVRANPGLVQMMADILGRTVSVPDVANPTALGAAIHGAVAAGAVRDFAEGAARYGAQDFTAIEPVPAHAPAYDILYGRYRDLAASKIVRQASRARP